MTQVLPCKNSIGDSGHLIILEIKLKTGSQEHLCFCFFLLRRKKDGKTSDWAQNVNVVKIKILLLLFFYEDLLLLPL
jgi:hypothetical protein